MAIYRAEPMPTIIPVVKHPAKYSCMPHGQFPQLLSRKKRIPTPAASRAQIIHARSLPWQCMHTPFNWCGNRQYASKSLGDLLWGNYGTFRVNGVSRLESNIRVIWRSGPPLHWPVFRRFAQRTATFLVKDLRFLLWLMGTLRVEVCYSEPMFSILFTISSVPFKSSLILRLQFLGE